MTNRPAHRCPCCPPARQRRGGFTITELMISVALVLILTLAIGLIFRTTSDTIGKSQAVGQVTRNLDAAAKSLQIDFTGTDSIDYDTFTDDGGILPNSEQVAIVISSFYVPTWANQTVAEADDQDYKTILNLNDELTAKAQWFGASVTLDTTGDTVEDGAVQLLNYGQRTFRTDLLSFGTRGRFLSQTGTRDQAFVVPHESGTAIVVYGHLKVFNNNYELPNSTLSYSPPAEPVVSGALGNFANVNNVFADQFVLGRFALLFSEPNAASTAGGPDDYIVAKNQSDVPFFIRNWGSTDELSSNIRPFDTTAEAARYYTSDGTVDFIQVDDPTPGTPPDDTSPEQRVDLNWGRYDVMGVSATELRERIGFVAAETPAAAQPAHVRGAFRRTGTGGDPYSRKPAASDPAVGGGAINGQPWWQNWFYTNNQRVWINPYGQQPFDAGKMGQRFHYLTPAARQFIVEYAGDYLEQDATGTIADVNGNGTVIEPDGQIDFIIDTAGRRLTRFYGFPRDVDGDQDIELYESTDSDPVTTGRYTSPDVFPLKDMVGINGAGTAESVADNATDALAFPHEKLVPVVQRTLTYGDTPATTPGPYTVRYVCAWGPDELDGLFTSDDHAPATTSFDFPLGPKLIRVVVEASDTEGKLEAPLQTELVFRVPD